MPNRVHNLLDHDRGHLCLQAGCSWSFKDSKDLKRHVASHTGMKSFYCPHAGCSYSQVGFGRAESLGLHLERKHTARSSRKKRERQPSDDSSDSPDSISAHQCCAHCGAARLYWKNMPFM